MVNGGRNAGGDAGGNAGGNAGGTRGTPNGIANGAKWFIRDEIAPKLFGNSSSAAMKFLPKTADYIVLRGRVFVAELSYWLSC